MDYIILLHDNNNHISRNYFKKNKIYDKIKAS